MKYFFTLFALSFAFASFSQVDSTIWENTETITTETYEFKVPTVWRNQGEMLTKGRGPEQFFEASGKGLPVTYNNGPVIVSVFLVKLNETNLKDAKKGIIKGYFENPDRVFKKKKDYEEESITLSDKNEAVLLNTRFYRKSKGLNQFRYDLVTFSDEYDTAYMFTVSIQFSDDTYNFEEEYFLKEYAKQLYETFKWK